ncbi:MAG TPA: bifunctional phosphopantothenoylcysteine decarboxylase/phosphopantothenate--cysteine ligase CoaBC [Saprospiraceae bacterium]|nr:bifunctional phosphopantothenoylcysteine decarboxylase/phosphopantothenate--cysteine ligase CoaBC [Saprospiraceae bacterium]
MKGKKIILAISGSIAAYKAAFLTRLFVKAGAEVQVVMTPAATNFIAPLSLSVLSKKEVYTDVISDKSWNNHVELGLWADALVVAPATANTLAKLAHGICDNIIAATYLSAKCPVFVAPAMDLDMWKHPATIENINRLRDFGNQIIPVGFGELASGLTGDGRMAEPEDIFTFLENYFSKSQRLRGKKILVTAGPTYEPIDPVRFIGNHSSGKMGVAIADCLATQGAEVTLVLGPSKINPAENSVKVIRVNTAEEMYRAAEEGFQTCDGAILAAAVADYRPKEIAVQKIKKKSEDLVIALEKTPDIAASLGDLKRKNQFIVGFALETNDEAANAKEKLEKKNFDFIVLNSLQNEGAGFNHDTNKISIFHKNNKARHFELKSKHEVAKDIVEEIIRTFYKN